MNENEIQAYLNEAAKEAEKLPIHDRDEQLKRIEGLKSYRGEDRIVSSLEIASSLESEPEQHKVMSGWTSFDKYTEGFTYEQLVVVSAAEKSGKTTWALQLINNMKEEEPCCFLFEQSPRELIRQMKDRQQEIPYFLTPLANIDNKFQWFEKRAMEAMVKNGSRVFLIDNMDWLEKEYPKQNTRTDEAVKDLLLKLKAFCVRWGVIVILIAHIRKVRMQDIPQPDDIKDTGAFKQIADTVIILWRNVKEEDVGGGKKKTKALIRTSETLVWVAENRRTGKTGYAQMIFDGKQFREKAWDFNLETAQEFNDYGNNF